MKARGKMDVLSIFIVLLMIVPISCVSTEKKIKSDKISGKTPAVG
jgi:hypothetical protein